MALAAIHAWVVTPAAPAGGDGTSAKAPITVRAATATAAARDDGRVLRGIWFSPGTERRHPRGPEPRAREVTDVGGNSPHRPRRFPGTGRTVARMATTMDRPTAP